MGIILPTFIASLWGDAVGGFVWAALIGRIASKQHSFVGTILPLSYASLKPGTPLSL